MLVAFSISPSTADAEGGVHDAVAAAVKVIRDSGLPTVRIPCSPLSRASGMNVCRW